jgi:hypothetical protein
MTVFSLGSNPRTRAVPALFRLENPRRTRRVAVVERSVELGT